MRFIGNKELATSEIRELLAQKGLVNKQLTLCDAFCGTGAISDSLKSSFNIIANDLLRWCVIYTRGRVCAGDARFHELGFDPFSYLNSNNRTRKGFFYQTYSPARSQRMYFTPENAGRIDYFRVQIEAWKEENLINENEYAYLLASLIESVSTVSNTAGVYGAFLKHWDSRALKPIEFRRVESKTTPHNDVEFVNHKIEDVISEIDCDVLYIDPPYTQNQYGTQYHLLETLVLYDCPEVSTITGSRKTAPMRSDWSKEYKSHILLDRILAKTNARYIVFSYSPDGFMSRSFIEASLKRYGRPETYGCHKISYRKYTNFKSRNQKNHFEYLFFVEKKEAGEVVYESPLNYIGSKAKMVSKIKESLPASVNTFVDAFGGGFNVGINADAHRVIYNDINHFVRDLVASFRTEDTYQYILFLKRIVNRFGLEKENGKAYKEVREFYNSLPPHKKDPRLLFAVILYGYNQQIRFNGNHEFNNPVGMRWFNDKVLEKMISFSRVLKEKNIIFESKDYSDLFYEIDKNTFTYFDPPYMLTNGAYNDGKRGFHGWNTNTEKKLFDFVDKLDNAGKTFMISYVLEHREQINKPLNLWVGRNDYKVTNIEPLPGNNRKEVLITNYKTDAEAETTLHDKKSIPKAA